MEQAVYDSVANGLFYVDREVSDLWIAVLDPKSVGG
jgi:hypothetical protein